MSNTFCKFLSNQTRIEYGQLRPCCWFKDSVDINDTFKVQQFLSSVEKIDSYEAANGNCSDCQYRELNNLYSPRLASFQVPELETATDNTKLSIEIQIDKDCNGACLICGPWNSTTWEKYENKTQNISTQKISNFKLETSNFVSNISKRIDFSSAKSVLFLGGEPLRTNSHLTFLNLIKDPAGTRIKYTTNGSYYPNNETLEMWSKFKEIAIQFSIDGIGKHFDYLRWPLQWDQVENNIQLLKNKPLPNIEITRFSYTTTPFSLYYHDRYVDWANKNFSNGDLMFSKMWQPRGHTPMALSAIPPLLQKEIKTKYGEDHQATNILEKFNSNDYRKFMSYITEHDQHRQLNWRNTFPEIAKFFR